jgi:hypothetical protein
VRLVTQPIVLLRVVRVKAHPSHLICSPPFARSLLLLLLTSSTPPFCFVHLTAHSRNPSLFKTIRYNYNNHMEVQSDIIPVLAHILTHMVEQNDKVPILPSQLSIFHSNTPPSITVHEYLERYALLSPSLPLSLFLPHHNNRVCHTINRTTNYKPDNSASPVQQPFFDHLVS